MAPKRPVLTVAPNPFHRRILVIGGSAGALEPLRLVVGALRPDVDAAVFVVIHTAAESQGLLPTILARSGRLPAAHGVDGEDVRTGRIYTAPPNHHLLLEGERVRVTRGPRENGFRPAIDPLFRSAAQAYGPDVVGVVLSGGLNDGTLGLARIKALGGYAIVQDPADAATSGMPQSAIDHVRVDHVGAAKDIAALLGRMRRRPSAPVRTRTVGMTPDPAEVGTDRVHDAIDHPSMTPFTCPECGGPLWEAEHNGLLRFECHVGHALTGETLVHQQALRVDQAMWTALRTLEEGAALRQRMRDHARKHRMHVIAREYDKQAAELEAQAATVREALVRDPSEQAPTSAVALSRRARRATRK